MPTENKPTGIPQLGAEIAEVARRTGESPWMVKQKCRQGRYKAKKSGRRTIVIWSSVEEDFKNLPDAVFAPPRRRHLTEPSVTVETAPAAPRRQRRQPSQAIPA